MINPTVREILKRVLWRPIRPVVNRMGFDIIRTDAYAFAPHITRLGVTVVIDVGANVGQYARQLRESGYIGKIVSFEPVAAAFQSLSEIAKGDLRWTTIHAALGSDVGEKMINVSKHTAMSSFSRVRDEFVRDHEWAKISRVESVNMTMLDTIFLNHVSNRDVVLLKMDVQGYEHEVLAGAERSLPRIAAIQTEMSLTASYSDQRLFRDLLSSIENYGFQFIDFSEISRDSDGRLADIDGFFERVSLT